MEVRLPDSLAARSGCQDAPAPSSEEGEALNRLVDGLPYWSYSKRQPQPMDVVNLVFVGWREEVEAAFAAAGWSGSHPNSMMAGFRVMRAVAEERVRKRYGVELHNTHAEVVAALLESGMERIVGDEGIGAIITI